MFQLIVTLTLLTLTNVDQNDPLSGDDEAELYITLIDAGGQEIELGVLKNGDFDEGEVWQINIPFPVFTGPVNAGQTPPLGTVKIRAEEDDVFFDDNIATRELDLSQDGTFEVSFTDNGWFGVFTTQWDLAYRVESVRLPILEDCEEQLKECADLTPEECNKLIATECLGGDGCLGDEICVDPSQICPADSVCVPRVPVVE